VEADEVTRILVVDDERVNRKILCDLLESSYEVIVAKSGQQALERAGSGVGVDLILLDIVMPGMDGYDVVRRLKQSSATRNIPVIFITAMDSIADEERGLDLGAVDYITKPFHPEIVRARVENHLRFVRQRRLLETLAGRDGLTELPNRRRLDEALNQEWRRCSRSGAPLSLAMVDVDFFKQYNDLFGHARGDQVLQSVARALGEGLRRPADLVARFGGEEFVVLLPETKVKGAIVIANGIRTAVESLAIPHPESRASKYVTVSVGGATLAGVDLSPQDLLDAADAMLYRSKELGRNRVAWRDAEAHRSTHDE